MDISYAAGLIDGEGYIGIVEAGGSMQLRLKVVMTDKGLPSLVAMHRAFGGRLDEDRPVGERTRASHVWRLNGRKAADLIERLQPKLLTKAESARIALQFQQMIDAAPKRTNRQAVWDEEMHRQARIFRARIQEANRRGPDPEPPVLPSARPIAVRRYGEWWEPDEDLFGPVEFTGRFPTSGQLIAGHIYPLDVQTTACSSSPGLLPTPDASCGDRGERSAEALARGDRQTNLNDLPRLLPTPTVSDTNGAGAHGTGGPDLRTALSLLPTPKATDGTKGGPNQRGSSGDLTMPSVVHQLLPTPTATPYGNNQSPSPGAAVRPSLDSLAPMLLPTPRAQHGEPRNQNVWARPADQPQNLENALAFVLDEED